MSGKMKFVKIKTGNNSYSNAIPIGVNAENVDFPNHNKSLQQIIEQLTPSVIDHTLIIGGNS